MKGNLHIHITFPKEPTVCRYGTVRMYFQRNLNEFEKKNDGIYFKVKNLFKNVYDNIP